jgi:phage-related minor tail protein
VTEEVRFILSADDTKSTAALKRTEDQLKKVSSATALTKSQMQQLNFQLTDIVTGLASGQSPFVVLLQQGGQLKDTFGGVNGALRAVTSVFTLGRVAALGFAGGIAAVVTAATQGWQESNKLRDAIILTGNAAGMTQGRFDALAKTISSTSSATIGDAREMALALASTGEIGAPAMEAATRAALAMQRQTGASTEEIVKNFASASRGVLKWAEEANRHYHSLTTEQLKLIDTLEKQGKVAQAMAIAFGGLQQPFEQHEKALGAVERAWIAVGKAASGAWDSMLSIGRPLTLEEQLAQVEQGIKNLQTPQRRGGMPRPGRDEALANAMANRDALLESIRLQRQAADSAAARAAANGQLGPQLTFDQRYPLPNIGGIIGSASEASRLRQNEAAGAGDIDQFLREQQNKFDQAMREPGALDAFEEMLDKRQEAWKEANEAMLDAARPEWEKLAEAWEDITHKMDEVGKRFADGFVDAGRGAFQEFLATGQVSAQSFKNLIISTLTELIYDRILAKNMATLGNMIWDWISAGVTGGGWGTGSTGTGGTGGGSAPTGGNGITAGANTWAMSATSSGSTSARRRGAGAAGGVTVNQTINVGSRVSYGEVYTAARVAKDAAVAQIKNEVARGNRFWDRS